MMAMAAVSLVLVMIALPGDGHGGEVLGLWYIIWAFRVSGSGLDTCGTDVCQQNRMGVECSFGGVSESDPVENPLNPNPGFEPVNRDLDFET